MLWNPAHLALEIYSRNESSLHGARPQRNLEHCGGIRLLLLVQDPHTPSVSLISNTEKAV